MFQLHLTVLHLWLITADPSKPQTLALLLAITTCDSLATPDKFPFYYPINIHSFVHSTGVITYTQHGNMGICFIRRQKQLGKDD